MIHIPSALDQVLYASLSFILLILLIVILYFLFFTHNRTFRWVIPMYELLPISFVFIGYIVFYWQRAWLLTVLQDALFFLSLNVIAYALFSTPVLLSPLVPPHSA